MGVEKTYTILITEGSGKQYTVTIKTDNIKFSMEQFQRNRPYFTWEIIDVG